MVNPTSGGPSAAVLARFRTLLIGAPGDVNKADDNGFTPLLLAAGWDQVMVVRTLILAGADVNKAVIKGVTPLLIGAVAGHEAVVRALIDA